MYVGGCALGLHVQEVVCWGVICLGSCVGKGEEERALTLLHPLQASSSAALVLSRPISFGCSLGGYRMRTVMSAGDRSLGTHILQPSTALQH